MVHKAMEGVSSSAKSTDAADTISSDRKGATTEQILGAAQQMPYLSSVRESLDKIHRHSRVSQMILSDGNTLFIGAFLDGNGMKNHFDYGIVSNIGSWTVQDGQGDKQSPSLPRLSVVHQSQQYGGHNCPRCPSNLCKTQALQNTLEKLFPESSSSNGERPRLVYIGDGANDSCPAVNVLGEKDVLLARVGKKRKYANQRRGRETDQEALAKQEYDGEFGLAPALQRIMEKNPSGNTVMKCQVHQWQTGDELKTFVEDILNEI
jgi:hypothetical protein